MPNIEPEPADIAGFWVGEIDDSSWCMQLAEDASVRYLSVIPKVNEFGVAVAGEYMNIVANGSYTLEPGGRLTLELTAMGVTNRMPLLLAQVSADKMVYYESQENDRTKFISRRVDSCNGFFEKHQSSGSA
ncbi:MAG: hypothetical protein KJP25_02755 [Gammaproteobacteria bacterium]|nr:hypothetical protein [Gammaproteobacteria bacterium]MBT8151145.1 hypothetical protein [Gammaproteobacteria bacterium]NND39315.1 hypothetical protein [Pseudomonadales bacterium]NNM11651.1 hypothetical protein [Pseudomonadales bacterium]RZV52206.1 MAG: hypothetical protein EX270_09725 [Pseudomonadales bacterium]